MLSSFSLPFPPSQTVSSESVDDTISRISTLINQPNWEQSNPLKLLVSHIPPHAASNVIAQHSHNIELGIRFFRWVCKQSTHCYDLDSRIYLLKLMVFRGLFVISHKAMIFLIRECSNGEDEIMKLMDAIENMRETGFRLNYSCYSSLLLCLAKLSMGSSAFLVCRRMVDDGFVLGVVDYKSIINALCKNVFVQGAEMVLSRVLRVGFDLDVHIYTSLVLGSCKKGDLVEAFRVFDIMSEEDGCNPNSVTYSILIHGLCETGGIDEAFRLKEEMSKKGCQPGTLTYTVLIKALCDIGCLLDEMAMKGCRPNDHTYTVLLDRLCGEGKIEEANAMFRNMLKDGLFPGTVTYNALINGYCKDGRVVSAFELLSSMERRNCKPNIRTYNELMEGLCRVNKPFKTMLLLRRVVDNGLLPSRVSYNILIDGFCREGQLSMAFNIMNSMDTLGIKPDCLTYTTLIDGLCKQGRPEQANGVLGLMMKKGISPDEVTLTALIDGYCRNGEAGTAFTLFERMVDHRRLMSPHIFNLFLHVLSKQFRVNETNAMLGKMVKYGLAPSVVTYTILIDGLCRAAHVKAGRLDCAFKIVRAMVKSGSQPNSHIYYALLMGFVMSGKATNEGAISSLGGLGANSLLIMENDNEYVANHVFREMDVDNAFELLDKIKECVGSTVDLYNLLVMGLCKVGRMSEAGHLVQDMVRRGFFPDKAVSSLIIEHFCKEKNFDYCLEFIKLIFNNGFIPSISSYCSVVLGLRKEGKVQEAEKLVSDLLRYADIDEKAAVSPYIEFLVKEDEPYEFLEAFQSGADRDTSISTRAISSYQLRRHNPEHLSWIDEGRYLT
ncbi:Pentatricopeptide repeat-containing protein [Camellia lanceoleosa]|uniref:Pentatricopeptide repeat-containing protein n=1 Tax=Camellia lanceoleosa TaxID=1840588 RepID=A0ACC0F3C8_9ERIC|nr:Pentatricopeptide repeat-containing protein [Camellia lanceoleosa]